MYKIHRFIYVFINVFNIPFLSWKHVSGLQNCHLHFLKTGNEEQIRCNKFRGYCHVYLLKYLDICALWEKCMSINPVIVPIKLLYLFWISFINTIFINLDLNSNKWNLCGVLFVYNLYESIILFTLYKIF